MFDGLWTVEFMSTINRFGRGVVVLLNGRLFGGDAGYYYSGTYEIKGNKIEGLANVTRYDETHTSVFGNLGQFKLKFSGEISSLHFSASASIIDKPDKLRLEGYKKEDI
jgi:hypothetical protein